MSEIKVLVATHKKYWMPEDSVYLPIHVGKTGKEAIGFAGDDTGENISYKNKNYCELTGLYWAWKNLEADYIGLAHYRRHFTGSSMLSRMLYGKKESVLGRSKLIAMLNSHDIILPAKRRYFIETNRSHYNHAHHARDLDLTEQIIREDYPEYIRAFTRVMGRTWAHRFNMFIMRRDYFDSYCEWLFSILAKLEEKIDLSGYNTYNARVFGFISERLLDVWLEGRGLKYKETGVIFMEKQNWAVKGSKFLMRKLIASQSKDKQVAKWKIT